MILVGRRLTLLWIYTTLLRRYLTLLRIYTTLLRLIYDSFADIHDSFAEISDSFADMYDSLALDMGLLFRYTPLHACFDIRLAFFRNTSALAQDLFREEPYISEKESNISAKESATPLPKRPIHPQKSPMCA